MLLLYGLTPWGNGTYFGEILLCFNFNMTFAMIIQDFGGQIGAFLSKYAYFAKNVTFDPLGCLCIELPPGAKVSILNNY